MTDLANTLKQGRTVNIASPRIEMALQGESLNVNLPCQFSVASYSRETVLDGMFEFWGFFNQDKSTALNLCYREGVLKALSVRQSHDIPSDDTLATYNPTEYTVVGEPDLTVREASVTYNYPNGVETVRERFVHYERTVRGLDEVLILEYGMDDNVTAAYAEISIRLGEVSVSHA